MSEEINLSDVNITKKALNLITRHSIDLKEFNETLITEKVVNESYNNIGPNFISLKTDKFIGRKW